MTERKRIPVILLLVASLVALPLAQARVFESDSGDVRIIGVPMVLQIGRSYCAPATMVRVLRYYGIEADQETLAQRVGSTEDNGTDVGKMLDEVSKICAGYNLKVETIMGFDYKRYAAIIAKYNAIAVKRGSPVLELDEKHIDLSNTFAKADIEMLRKTSTKKDLRAFAKTVREHVLAETPLIWGAVLGIAAEPDIAPYTSGGHLRLIIGFNDKTKEIIYSDPWGPKHATKRMALADAYAITMSLHALASAPEPQ